MDSLLMDSKEAGILNLLVPNEAGAVTIANSVKLQSFKLYDIDGCFQAEYQRFDGKYRRLENGEGL